MRSTSLAPSVRLVSWKFLLNSPSVFASDKLSQRRQQFGEDPTFQEQRDFGNAYGSTAAHNRTGVGKNVGGSWHGPAVAHCEAESWRVTFHLMEESWLDDLTFKK